MQNYEKEYDAWMMYPPEYDAEPDDDAYSKMVRVQTGEYMERFCDTEEFWEDKIEKNIENFERLYQAIGRDDAVYKSNESDVFMYRWDENPGVRVISMFNDKGSDLADILIAKGKDIKQLQSYTDKELFYHTITVCETLYAISCVTYGDEEEKYNLFGRYENLIDILPELTKEAEKQKIA